MNKFIRRTDLEALRLGLLRADDAPSVECGGYRDVKYEEDRNSEQDEGRSTDQRGFAFKTAKRSPHVSEARRDTRLRESIASKANVIREVCVLEHDENECLAEGGYTNMSSIRTNMRAEQDVPGEITMGIEGAVGGVSSETEETTSVEPRRIHLDLYVNTAQWSRRAWAGTGARPRTSPIIEEVEDSEYDSLRAASEGLGNDQADKDLREIGEVLQTIRESIDDGNYWDVD